MTWLQVEYTHTSLSLAHYIFSRSSFLVQRRIHPSGIHISSPTIHPFRRLGPQENALLPTNRRRMTGYVGPAAPRASGAQLASDVDWCVTACGSELVHVDTCVAHQKRGG